MPAILRNHYVLAVHDVTASARFYTDVLGFRIVAEPSGWIFVERDGCTIMLGECPESLPASALGDHSYFGYLNVDDVDAFYAQAQRAGAALGGVMQKPWGMREFALRTPDGHRIMIGQATG